VRLASGLASLVLLSTLAHAEPAPTVTTPPAYDAHPALVEQVGAELQTIDKTLAIVNDKLSAAEAARLARVRAAYRILRAPLSEDASASDRMASARRRAAARLLLERDREERTLLANEASALRAARETTVVASAKVPTVVLPESLLQPVRGSIARTFGTILHERSRTTLSRRGLDFEVEVSAAVVAPADGTVRYAGPMRGLDNGVVLDHGDYFTVVAKLAEVAIPVGTKIARGDRIGHAARHRVYLEVRAKVGPGGLPIDPQPLLARQ
jgi:septal ring factor EnvC (AmiA/AmiB activator)